MTLREIIDQIGIDDDPLGCAFAFMGVIRTSLQGEPSTAEGECASLLKASKIWGRMDDPANLRRMLDSPGFRRILDLNVPDSLLLSIAAAGEADEVSQGDLGGTGP